MVVRLSIFNSSKLLLLIITIIILGVLIIECFYKYNNIPVPITTIQSSGFSNKNIFILGDSRAQIGLVPEEIKKIYRNYDVLNIARPGANIYNQIELLKTKKVNNNIIILCVSPASVFGGFINDIDNTKEKKRNIYGEDIKHLFHLYDYVEPKFKKILKNNFRFTYGFSGITDLILFGTVSEYSTADGWHSLIRLGSDVTFTRMVNYYTYSQKVLVGDSTKIELLRWKFEKSISNLIINNKVILVRLPIDQKLKKLEDKNFTWFDEYMSEIAKKYNMLYLPNLTNFKYPKKKY